MRTRRSARTNLAIYAILTILMGLMTLVILAGAAVSIASAQVPGKSGNLLTILTPPSGSSASEEITLSRPDGSSARSISPPVEHSSRNQTFAPDGKTIAFGASGRPSTPDAFGIFRYQPGDTKRTLIWRPSAAARIPYQPLSFSPSGSKLLMTYFYSDCDLFPCQPELDPASGLYVRDLETKETRRLSLGPGVTPFEAHYSPDGRQIVMASADEPENAEGDGSVSIFVSSSDGEGAQRIYRSDDPIGGLSVSPDGRRVAFTMRHLTSEEDLTDIYTIKTDGTGLKRITDDNRSFDSVYSADGNRIAMTKIDTESGIDLTVWTSKVDGSNSRQVFANREGDEELLDWGRARPFRIVSLPPNSSRAMVQTWGPGTVTVSGPVFAKKKRIAGTAGIVRVPIAIKRGIRLRAGAKFRLNVRFAPKGGFPSTLTRYIKLG